MQTIDQQEDTPVTPGRFVADRAPELLDDLLELTQLLNQRDTVLYWRRCAEILLSYTDVDAVSFWLFPSHESIPEGNRSPPLPTREELSDNQVCYWGKMSHFRQK